MNAVLREEPADPLALNPALPPAAAVAVRRCLEKSREERFQSARDLAFHLHQLAQASSGSHPVPSLPVSRRRLLVVGGLGAVALLAAVPWLLGPSAVAPTFQQLTFHRGRIGGARFAGEAIVYSLAVGLRPPEVALRLTDSPEARPMGYAAADVLASCGGDLALGVRRRFVRGDRTRRHARVAPLGGGAPTRSSRTSRTRTATRSGEFAVARSTRLQRGAAELEYPVGAGAVPYERARSTAPAVARRAARGLPGGPDGLGTGGHVVVVDRDGESCARTREWTSARGLAWSPRGDEVWFTAAEERANRSLRAVRVDGRERLVLESPGSLTIWDAAPTGACCSPATTSGWPWWASRRGHGRAATSRGSTARASPRSPTTAASSSSATASASTSGRTDGSLAARSSARAGVPGRSLAGRKPRPRHEPLGERPVRGSHRPRPDAGRSR